MPQPYQTPATTLTNSSVTSDVWHLLTLACSRIPAWINCCTVFLQGAPIWLYRSYSKCRLVQLGSCSNLILSRCYTACTGCW